MKENDTDSFIESIILIFIVAFATWILLHLVK